MSASRAVDMAALDGYAQLLSSCGHIVRIFSTDGAQMWQQRCRSAKHIFEQCKKIKIVSTDAVCNPDVMDVSDINKDGRYYAGFLFVPNVAARYVSHGRSTAAADAALCDGVGLQLYGTAFEDVTYDSNMHLFPLVLAHFIGAESAKYWKLVFEKCKHLPGFDDLARPTIVDQKKSIDSAYKETFSLANLFVDPLRVRKNLGASLGSKRAAGLSLYDKTLHALSRLAVDEIVAEYTPAQKAYFDKFVKSELYLAYSSLVHIILSSQGAKS